MSDQIGTIVLLQQRIYPLDASADPRSNQAEVVVEPGSYKLYRDGISTYWMMEGKLNTGRLHRMGDGMFSVSANDQAGGPTCVFPSAVFGPDEWDRFVNEDPVTQPGPDQRIRVILDEDPSKNSVAERVRNL